MKLIPNLAPIDRKAIDELGIPSLLLMEEAGRSVADRVERIIEDEEWDDPSIVVICGAGNNGGDGLVCARYLAKMGYEQVMVFHTVGADELQGDARVNYDLLTDYPVSIFLLERSEQLESHLEEAQVVVDALFGSGLNRSIEGYYRAVIEAINETEAVVVAVDMPSGIQGENGWEMGASVQADYTVTFAAAKPAFYLYPGKDRTGELSITDIGIPEQLIEADPSRIYLIDGNWAKEALPERQGQTHKYDYGNVLVIAGSRRMPGAACMAAEAALRSGAGIVRLATVESALMPMPLIPEVLRLPLPESPEGWLTPEAMTLLMPELEKATTVVIGPGMGQEPQTVALIDALLHHLQARFTGTVVIDADGLNCLTRLPERPQFNKRFILTPHVGEGARLLGCENQEVLDNLIQAAQRISDAYEAVVVLKSASTLVHHALVGSWITPTGNPGMATAGCGDVLTGFIAGWAAQGLTSCDAARLGVFLHGLAGDVAAEEQTQYCLIATDLIHYLSDAIHTLRPA